MATFVTIKGKNGISYQAIIRKKGHKPIKRTFPTKSAARIWATEQETLIQKKRYNDPRLAEAVTLTEAIDKYERHSRTVLKKSPTTLEREIISKKHLLRIIGEKTPLSDIKTSSAYNYQEKRISEKASSSSIRQELSMLSRMYRIAKTLGNSTSKTQSLPLTEYHHPPAKKGF